jgi:hypothetical protein
LRNKNHRQDKAGARIDHIDAKQVAPVLLFTDISQISEQKPNTMDDMRRLKTLPLDLKSIKLRKISIEKVEEIYNPQRRFRPYMSAGIIVSPDFSGTGIAAFSKSGNNIGFTLEYHFSRRMSVATGVIRSIKLYTVTSGFEPYEGYWDYKPSPNFIDGGCTVLDIPINIKYQVIAGARNNLFLSTGLSSYIMTKEHYNYVYNNYQNHYEIKNKNKHLFAIHNVSVGYERHLGPNWTLGVEPFLKTPLSAIGYGNLKLMSAGANFSINYHFNKRRP